VVVAPLLGALTLLAVGGYLAWSFYDSADHFELAAENGWFELLVPVLMIGSGLLAAAWARWHRRAPYFTAGFGASADDGPAPTRNGSPTRTGSPTGAA
jgi:hypothetical protein